MQDFKRILFEALFVAFGKILSKYNTFAQGSILRDVGQEIIEYLQRHGFEFQEQGDLGDLDTLIELFVNNGFADKLDITPAAKGRNYTWHNLYGLEAYKELHEISDNPFLACPLNLCLYYLADKHGATMRLHRKTFDLENKICESQYEMVDKGICREEKFDALVIENVRLYELARERAERLEKAQKELKILEGILPICSSCKKILNAQGEWQQLEGYVREHSQAEFTHSYCPDCYAQIMRELTADDGHSSASSAG